VVATLLQDMIVPLSEIDVDCGPFKLGP
jgi:hypothetical protein